MDKQISLASNMSVVIQSTDGTIKNPLTGRKIQIGNAVYKKLLKDKIIIETVKPTSVDVPRLSLPNYGPASGKKQRKMRKIIRKQKYLGSSAEDKSFFSHSYSDTDSLVSNLSNKQYSDEIFDINKNSPNMSELTAAEKKRLNANKRKPTEGFVKGTRHAKTSAVPNSKQDIQALLRNALYVKKVWAKQEARGVSPNIFNKFSQYHKKLTGSDSVSSVGSSQYSANMDYSAGSSVNKTFSDYESNRSMLPSSASSSSSKSVSDSSASVTRNLEFYSYNDNSVPEASSYDPNDKFYLENKIKTDGLKGIFESAYDYTERHPQLKELTSWKKLEKDLQKVLDDNDYKTKFLKPPAILAMQNLIKDAYKKAESTKEKNLIIYLDNEIVPLWDLHYTHLKYARHHQNLSNYLQYGTTKM